jgi:methyl-accepting chemotaxis protein
MVATSSFGWWNRLRLQWRLGLAFLVMAPLIAAAGGGGLFFINKISDSVAQIETVAKPLASAATRVADAVDAVLVGLVSARGEANNVGLQRATSAITEGETGTKQDFAVIQALAKNNNVDIDIRGAKLSVGTFFAQGRQVVSALERQATLTGVSEAKFSEFGRNLDEIVNYAGQLSSLGETLMNGHQGRSRALTQSGTASVEDMETILSETLTKAYPVLRGAYRLQARVAELRDIARTYLAAGHNEDLSALEQKFDMTVKSAVAIQAGLARDPQTDIADVAKKIGDELEQVQGASGDDGFFRAHADALAASARAAEVSKGMGETANAVRSTLSKVMARANEINSDVDAAAQEMASTALVSTSVILLIGVFLSMAYGAFTARSIARPLSQMAGVMGQLAGGDEEAAIPGLGRGDEIGDMARSLTTIRDTGVRAARIQTALENTASVVVMADLEGKTIYANQAAQRYFREQEGEIRARLPEFQAGEIANTNVASFFGDAEGMTGRLRELSEGYHERVRFGGRTVDITANPVLNEAGGRLGTVVEWADVTDQLKVEAEIVEGVGSIKAATVQLTAGSQDLSARTEEQVASLEEMAASIRELSVTVKQNADNAQQANQLALAARGAAEGGGDVATSAMSAMGEIEQSSQRIAEIVGLIDEIAFQTNLLALNAAVEAARAGDAGRGFAVVAAEVRSLAQRSSQASKEIKGLISTSNGHVKRGVELVGRAGSSLGEIVTSVKKVADIVSEIAAASQEQSAGVQEVDEAVTQMEGVTQKNAALVEESTASVNSVDRQMEQLSRVVKYLRTGAEAAGEPRPQARVLQEGLSQRLGVETAAETTGRPHAEHAPAKRAAGSRLSEF